MRIKELILLPALLLAAISPALSSGTKDDIDVRYKYNLGVAADIKLCKGLHLELSPELRFYEGYDKLHLNAGVDYKIYGGLHIGAAYRMVVDRVESASSQSSLYTGWGADNYDSEIYHRYSFDLSYRESFGRFKSSLRLKYNNYADEEVDDKDYMRYRFKTEYNIRKCPITPYLSLEAYQSLTEHLLYKMRYSSGFDIKVGKGKALTFDYKFDMFALEYKNTHIFGFGYKFKF